MAYSAHHINAPDQTRLAKSSWAFQSVWKVKYSTDYNACPRVEMGNVLMASETSEIQLGNMRPMSAAWYQCRTMFPYMYCTRRIGAVQACKTIINRLAWLRTSDPSIFATCFSFLPTVSSAPSLYTPQPEAFLFYFHTILLTDREGPPTLLMLSKWPLLLLNAVHKKSCYNISG